MLRMLAGTLFSSTLTDSTKGAVDARDIYASWIVSEVSEMGSK